jgi:integrase
MKTKIAIKEYLEWKNTYAPRASRAYKIHLNRIPVLDTEKITIKTIIDFNNSYKIYSPSTNRYAMTIFKNFIKYLEIQNKCEPVSYFIRTPRGDNKRRKVVQKDDFLKIIDIFNEYKYTELRNKLIICLLWDTGVRVSELCDIIIDDLMWNDQMAIIKTKKNNNDRHVAWCDTTHDLFIKYMGVRLCKDVEKVFDLTTRQVQRIIEQSCKKLDIVSYTPHSFRHAKAHRMLECGANVKEIASVLGHSEDNPVASFQYMKLDQSELKRIVKKYL